MVVNLIKYNAIVLPNVPALLDERCSLGPIFLDLAVLEYDRFHPLARPHSRQRSQRYSANDCFQKRTTRGHHAKILSRFSKTVLRFGMIEIFERFSAAIEMAEAISKVSDDDVNRYAIKALAKVADGDEVVGTINDMDIRRVHVASQMASASSALFAAQARATLDQDEEKFFNRESAKQHMLQEILEKLFWMQVNLDYEAPVQARVCLREGWQMVKIEARPFPIPGMFR